MKPTISVCTPMLNEEFFLPIWFGCVAGFADEVVITDGGSTDNTAALIEELAQKWELRLDLKVSPQEGRPYSNDWNEGAVRNYLLNRCQGDYVLALDADEVVTKEDILYTIEMMQKREIYTLAEFRFVPFWGDLHHVRENTESDPRWFGVPIAKFFKNGCWKYTTDKHHCILTHAIVGRSDFVLQTQVYQSPGRLYHLHYGFGERGIKFGDNRRGDLGDPDELDEGRASPDFGFRGIEPVEISKYDGPWPSVLEEFL